MHQTLEVQPQEVELLEVQPQIQAPSLFSPDENSGVKIMTN